MKDLTRYTIYLVARRTIFEQIPTSVNIGGAMQYKSEPIYCTFDKFFIEIVENKIYIRKNQSEERIFKIDYNSEFVYKIMKTKIVTSSNKDLFNFIDKGKNFGDLFYFKVINMLENIYNNVKQIKI